MASRTFSQILTLAALLAPLVLSPVSPSAAQSDSHAVDVGPRGWKAGPRTWSCTSVAPAGRKPTHADWQEHSSALHQARVLIRASGGHSCT
jgi:hypothetical protein